MAAPPNSSVGYWGNQSSMDYLNYHAQQLSMQRSVPQSYQPGPHGIEYSHPALSPQFYHHPEEHQAPHPSNETNFAGFPYDAPSVNVGEPAQSFSPTGQSQIAYPVGPGYRSASQNSFSSSDPYAVSSPSYTHQQKDSPILSPGTSHTPRRTETPGQYPHGQLPLPDLGSTSSGLPFEHSDEGHGSRQPKLEDEESMSPEPSKSPSKSRKPGRRSNGQKQSHNQVEKNYRTKLNESIWLLGDLVFGNGLRVFQTKQPKNMIAEGAKDMILALQAEVAKQKQEIADMRTRMAVLEHASQHKLQPALPINHRQRPSGY